MKYERYESYLNALRVHKTSLKSIIKNDEVIPKIQKIVNDVHFIKFHTCNILKIFCLHKFDETNKSKNSTDWDHPPASNCSDWRYSHQDF